jgi:hypothetical protein
MDAPFERGYTPTLVLRSRPAKAEIPRNRVSARTEEETAMAIIAVSRWKGDYEKALPILREASPIMKQSGAISLASGVCHAGSGAGLIHTAATFPDWAAYGRNQENPEFRRVLAEFLKVVERVDNSIIIGGEV